MRRHAGFRVSPHVTGRPSGSARPTGTANRMERAGWAMADAAIAEAGKGKAWRGRVIDWP